MKPENEAKYDQYSVGPVQTIYGLILSTTHKGRCSIGNPEAAYCTWAEQAAQW